MVSVDVFVVRSAVTESESKTTVVAYTLWKENTSYSGILMMVAKRSLLMWNKLQIRLMVVFMIISFFRLLINKDVHPKLMAGYLPYPPPIA